MNKENKYITTAQALALVKNGYKIAFAEAQGAPRGFLGQLHTIKKTVTDLEVWQCRLPHSFPYLEDEDCPFRIRDTFLTKPTRSAKAAVEYVPCNLSQAGKMALSGGKLDIYVFACTPPDENGKMSAGLGGVWTRELRENSRILIGEINRNMPYTYGDTEFNICDLDYVTEENIPLTPIPLVEVGEREKKIGNIVAQHICDGDCLQVGIGAIPDALIQLLTDKKDLGIHTELLGDGIVELINKGVVNGSKKSLHYGKVVTSTVDGTQRVFDFCNRNKSVLIKDSSYTNNADVLAANDRQVSVNTALEIDLTGQCSSESKGSVQFSGTGGQTDTAVGAQMAKGGKSFMTLCSTAVITDNGVKKEISKIVPQLKSGAAVSLQRNSIQYVVTEYGLVNLRGKGIGERAKLLISIAHPQFREELTQKAKEIGLIK